MLNTPKETNNKIYFNHMRITNKAENIRFNKKLKNNILNNYNKLNIKEPNDSSSKKIVYNQRFLSYLLDKKPRNIKNKKLRIRSRPQSNEGKNIIKKKKLCEFCGSCVVDLVVHFEYYHLIKTNELIIPIKRDTALLNEKLNNMSIDEAGINENNKKYLLRKFMPNLLGSSIGCKDNNLKSEKIGMYAFVKPEKIEK